MVRRSERIQERQQKSVIPEKTTTRKKEPRSNKRDTSVKDMADDQNNRQGADIPLARQNQLDNNQAQPQVGRTIKDFIAPNAIGYQSPINAPNVEANNFEVKPALTQLVANNQFGGGPDENPNKHISLFLRICDTLKMNGVSKDALYLRLFPFSLRGRASDWLWSQGPGKFTTWDQLASAFLNQYFPPSMTAKYRGMITSFQQRDGEALSEAWERYKEYIRLCPHHGLQKWLIISTFYMALDQADRSVLDQAAGGMFNDMELDEAWEIIEKVSTNSRLYASERSYPKKHGGRYDMNSLQTDHAIDSLSQKFDSLAAKFDTFHVSSSNPPVAKTCEICGKTDHVTVSCPFTIPEDANYIAGNQRGGYRSDYTPGTPFNPTYTPANRNHPNLSYKTTNPIPPGFQLKQQPSQHYQHQNQFQQPVQHQQNQHMQPSSQALNGTSSIESMLAGFLAEQKKESQENRNMIRELNAKVDQLATQNKLLENQVAQQASSSLRQQGMLPSKPDANFSESCSAITLRNGRQLDDPQPRTRASKVNDPVPFEEIAEEESVKEAAQPVEKPYVAPPPYKPPVPFPQRLMKAKNDQHFTKFVEMLRKLYITLPFTEVITQVPSYSKFLKDIISRRRKIDEHETVALNEECSAIIQNALPPKLQDPGSFSIPINIGAVRIDKALCDLGASISLMPYSLCRKLAMGDLTPTSISLRLADRSSSVTT